MGAQGGVRLVAPFELLHRELADGVEEADAWSGLWLVLDADEAVVDECLEDPVDAAIQVAGDIADRLDDRR